MSTIIRHIYFNNADKSSNNFPEVKQDKNTMESYQLEMSLVDSRDDKLALIKWKCLETIY